MNTYIYENNISITPILCREIIELFEGEKIKNRGVTIGGYQPNIKDTTDFNIPKCDDETSNWFKIEKFLYKELNTNLLKYIKQINCPKYNKENNNGIDGSIFLDTELKVYSFMIQKYLKNEGKYTYHNDFAINQSKNHRVITYIWYLNTVTEGGETEFWDSFKIKPTAGKLVLFPSTWTFHHRGLKPISDDKYIITGWFYI